MYLKIRDIILATIIVASTPNNTSAQKLPIDLKEGWELSWSDEFNYPDSELDKEWISQNKRSGGMVISSRWRENAVVRNGVLELVVKKEERDGQEWTAASIWTKKQFHYGYYECRYKYAGATGTNNSFWMWPVGGVAKGEKKYELDVNEGHYPATINTNFHNWTDKKADGSHDIWPELFHMGKGDIKPAYSHELKRSIKAEKIRFSSQSNTITNIGEFSIYAPYDGGYPQDPMNYKEIAQRSELVNLAQKATVTTSQGRVTKGKTANAKNITDGTGNSWSSQAEGEKWIEFDLGGVQDVGCIQFTNGWLYKSCYKHVALDYKIEYYNGTKWVEIANKKYPGKVDFSKEYHTYGMLWDETQISYYFDGKLLRTHKHTDIISPTNIYLSLAILSDDYAGAVTDELDGKSMKVDYVRFYEKK